MGLGPSKGSEDHIDDELASNGEDGAEDVTDRLPDTLSLSFSHTEVDIKPSDFTIISLLGQGSFGKVFLVRDTLDDAIYAMKVLRKDVLVKDQQVEHTVAERFIMSHLVHPNLVRLRYAFQTEVRLFLVMDYMRGGELFTHLQESKRFGEERAKHYVAQITLALEYLHDHNVVYRDLKPENILLDENGNIQLTDFGLSKPYVTSDEGAKTFCGTAEYIAPETLVTQSYGASVDWWALGALTYEMLAGRPPFYHTNRQRMFWMIVNMDLGFPSDLPLTSDARDILQGLLAKDPSQRLDAQGVKQHPWFAGMDWDKLYRMELTPPFRPQLADVTDVRYFDPVFTKEAPRDSIVSESVAGRLGSSTQAAFEGFTFINRSQLNTLDLPQATDTSESPRLPTEKGVLSPSPVDLAESPDEFRMDGHMG